MEKLYCTFFFFFNISQLAKNNVPCVYVHTTDTYVPAPPKGGGIVRWTHPVFKASPKGPAQKATGLSLSLSLGLADLSSALTLAWISRAHSCQTNYSIYEMGVSTCVT